MNELKSWSYSKYSCYCTCPFQFKMRYIEKEPEPEAPALTKGIRVHEEAENFLNGEWEDVPESCSKLEEQFHVIRDREYIAEQAWAFDEDWNPVDFFSPDAFLRMKIDAMGFPDDDTVKLIDFKTGKVRDTYQKQVELYTVAAFTHYDLTTSLTEFWFLDHGHISDEKEYHMDDYEKLVRRWDSRIQPMFNDTRFNPTPNFLCKNYCNFASHKGGQCKYGE